MKRQLHFEFNPKKLEYMRSISQNVKKAELIKGLSELYLDFIQLTKEEGSCNGTDNEPENKGISPCS